VVCMLVAYVTSMTLPGCLPGETSLPRG
jgi:hypothetical protein